MVRRTDTTATSATNLTFRETMTGSFTMGAADPEEGARGGEAMALHATVTVDDIVAFLGEPRPPGRLDGELELPGGHGRVPFTNGMFRLFPLERAGGRRTLMVYELGFDLPGEDGEPGEWYHFAGTKSADERPALPSLWRDTTTLRVRLYRGSHARGEVVGAGVLRLSAPGLAMLAASMRTPGAGSPVDAVRALGGYAWLFAKTLTSVYVLRR